VFPFESEFQYKIYKQKYSRDGVEEWTDTVDRVVTAVGYSYIRKYMEERVFIPGGRYLYACGRPVHNVSNCFALRAIDSREGWAKLMYDSMMTLMMGGGIGVDYSALRPAGTPIIGTGGIASGPISLMKALDAAALNIRQGGSRRSALWSGLDWQHKDIYEFIKAKHRTPEERARKAKDFNEYLPLELTNLSINLDRLFFMELERGSEAAKKLWTTALKSALETGDPGFSVNYNNPVESLRNACSEFISEDSGDSCNLGTVFINRIRDKDHMAEVVRHAMKFLIRGALYTNRPTEDSRRVSRENNKVGLGLGGIGEFLLRQGSALEVTPELRGLLEVYAEESERVGRSYARKIGLSEPKSFRAIAPNGTIAILAGTTGGIEPLFCTAYKRSFWRGDEYTSEVVIDPVAQRLLADGRHTSTIYDAHDIDFEQRVKFQAEVQEYVDMGISSTVNLPMWGTDKNNFTNVQEKGDILLKYIKRLRGITVYPDGAIGGQPLQKIPLDEALKMKEGVVIEGMEETCKGGVCGL